MAAASVLVTCEKNDEIVSVSDVAKAAGVDEKVLQDAFRKLMDYMRRSGSLYRFQWKSAKHARFDITTSRSNGKPVGLMDLRVAGVKDKANFCRELINRRFGTELVSIIDPGSPYHREDGAIVVKHYREPDPGKPCTVESVGSLLSRGFHCPLCDDWFSLRGEKEHFYMIHNSCPPAGISYSFSAGGKTTTLHAKS